MTESSSDVPVEISVQDVKQRLDAKDDFLLLDCRETEEFRIAHIEGAQLVPMTEIQQRIGELDDWRERDVIVYCHLGGRSLQVVAWMRQLGFSRAQNMTGGIQAWSNEVDPSVPKY